MTRRHGGAGIARTPLQTILTRHSVSNLNLVFTYAGTASLEKELTTITGKELQVGDVIINGGHPGHTVIVVDKAVNKKGEAVYLLAQGYTPAQEIEIFNQWFSINPQIKYLDTPDWYFRGNYAKRF